MNTKSKKRLTWNRIFSLVFVMLFLVSSLGLSVSASEMPCEHTAVEVHEENVINASCSAAGSFDNVTYCMTCGEELGRETIFVPALSHTSAGTVREQEIPATCEGPGKYDEVEYCSVCGAEISRRTVEEPALPHTPGPVESVPDIAATCTTPGSHYDVVKCTICGQEISRELKSDPIKGHTPADPVIENMKAATCSEPGSYEEVVYCADCGAELRRDTVTDTSYFEEHQWNEGVVTKEPTQYEDGEETFTCEVCGEVRTEVIPKLSAVRVVFTSKVPGMRIEIYPGPTDAVPMPAAIRPEADGSWSLLPGYYEYTAAAEGYEKLEKAALTIFQPENGETMVVEVHLKQIAGKCGKTKEADLTWKLDEEGKLTIKGKGAMADYKDVEIDSSKTAPWYEIRSDIKEVEILEGVTSIGDYAFRECDKLESVKLSHTVTSIGEHAFDKCDELKTVEYDGSDVQWKEITVKEDNPSLQKADIKFVTAQVPAVNEETEQENVPAANEEAEQVIVPAANGKAEQDPDPVPMPAFTPDSVYIDGVEITVSAPEGVFPEGAALRVRKVPAYKEAQVEEAVEAVRDENVNVAVSYTFDIEVVDAENNKLQPTDGSKVKVSFALAEVAEQNLDTSVYHVNEDKASGEMEVEELEVTEVLGTEPAAVVETEGFSYYTVEFTYQVKQYVLQGGGSVLLSEILQKVDLTGTVDRVTVSNSNLFDVVDENGVWTVYSYQPFDTSEWMKVVIGGQEYVIAVTDSRKSGETISVSSQEELEEAFGNALKGDIIKLENNIEVNKMVREPPDKKLTLDLNGMEISGTTASPQEEPGLIYISERSELIITGNGKITPDNNIDAVFINRIDNNPGGFGILRLANGTVKRIFNKGNLYVEGGTVTTDTDFYAICNDEFSGMTMTGGVVEQKGGSNDAIAIINYVSSCAITGGKISAAGKVAIRNKGYASITIHNKDGSRPIIDGSIMDVDIDPQGSVDYDIYGGDFNTNPEGKIKSGYIAVEHAGRYLVQPQDASEHIHDDGTEFYIAWNSDDSLPGGGNHYLTTDVTINGKWTISSSIHLCLNGHTITFNNGDDWAIDIPEFSSGRYLGLYNCDNEKGGIIINGKKGIHCACWFYLYNVTISMSDPSLPAIINDIGLNIKSGTIKYIENHNEMKISGNIDIDRIDLISPSNSDSSFQKLIITDKLVTKTPIKVKPYKTTDNGEEILTYPFTKGLFGNGDESSFTSVEPGYEVVLNDDYEAFLHKHNFSYEASGGTITVACSEEGCYLKDNQATLTIAKPEHEVYGDGKNAEAIITDENSIRNGAPINYFKAKADGSKDGTALSAPPTDSGTYRAEITLGTAPDSATAFVVYTIAKADPEVTAPVAKKLSYNGAAQALVKAGETTGGTMQYALGTDAKTAPASGWGTAIPAGTDAKTYFVWYKVVGDQNYNDKAPKVVEAAISKVDPDVTAPGAKTLSYNGAAQALVNAGKTTGGTMQYALGTDAKTAPASGWNTAIPEGTDAKTYYVWYKVAGDQNYNDAAPKVVEVTISKSNISYTVSGQEQEYVKGSKTSLTFVINRSENDKEAIDHFTGATYNNAKLTEKYYDVESGSIKLTLKPEFLEPLQVGSHTVKVLLDDAGPLDVSFKVVKKDTATYTVTFNNNGVGTAPEAQKVEAGKTAKKPTNPTASGYTFGGWYTDKECTKAFDFSTPITGNITLYAKWTKNSSGGSSTGGGSSRGVPGTGDSNNAGLWIALMALSVLAIAGTAAAYRKRR